METCTRGHETHHSFFDFQFFLTNKPWEGNKFMEEILTIVNLALDAINQQKQ